MTAEQKARDLLERMGVTDAQNFTAGELVELANLIANANRKPDLLMTITAGMGANLTADSCMIAPGDIFYCYKNWTLDKPNWQDKKIVQSRNWTLDKPNPFRFEKAVIPDEPERISERLKPPF